VYIDIKKFQKQDAAHSILAIVAKLCTSHYATNSRNSENFWYIRYMKNF